MSSPPSALYFEYLKENQKMRKQIKTLKDSLKFYRNENCKKIERISQLEACLEELYQVNSRDSCFYIQENLNLSSNSYSQISRSSSLKKMFTKEFDSEVLYENCSDCYSKEPNFFLSFHVVSLVQRNGKVLKDLRGEILFSFPEDKNLEVKSKEKIIEFAFPYGIFFDELGFRDSLVNQVSEIIYQSHYRDGNSYVTQFKVDDEQIYACFVLFNDLGVTEHNINCMIPVCYCLLSIWPCFELHFGVLNRLLDLKRTTRCDSSSTFMESGDFSKLILEDIVTCEELSLLSKYYSYLSHSLSEESLSIQISLDSVESIEYEFPQNLSSLDHQWFCPVLFSALGSKLLSKVYLAVIQERRVVLFSKNVDLVTSSVFALNCLLEPFKWRLPLVPLLTRCNKAELENWSGFVVGTVDEKLKILKKSNFWLVDLDNKEVHRKGECENIFKPKSFHLRSLVRKYFRVFRRTLCFIPNEEQEKCTTRIIKQVHKFNLWVINSLQNLCISKNILDFQINKEIIDKKSIKADKDFFVSVFESKLFQLFEN